MQRPKGKGKKEKYKKKIGTFSSQTSSHGVKNRRNEKPVDTMHGSDERGV